MRPSELDYTSQAKHYFDISNGEVLVSAADRREYVQNGADPATVVELGPLLRELPENIDHDSYERLDVSGWLPEQYVAFGKWIYRVVSPPPPNEKKLNSRVLKNARLLGVGAGLKHIANVFGTRGNFYVASNVKDAHKIGQFNDLTLDDAVAYVKRVGATTQPRKNVFKRRSKLNSRNPSYDYLQDRFGQIGGFTKLLELAGFPDFSSWEIPDCEDWGVQVMEANAGLVPTARVINYFSVSRLGPSRKLIAYHFRAVRQFQDDITQRYQENQQDKENMLETLRSETSNGKLPRELLMAYSDAEGYSGDPELFIEQNPAEAIRRFAEYQVVAALLPHINKDTKIRICQRSGLYKEYKNFQACIRRFLSRFDEARYITDAEVEYQALTMGLFDSIWPSDGHLERLKLGEDFLEYCRRVDKLKTVRFASRLWIPSG
jgi:hypothetical protein